MRNSPRIRHDCARIEGSHVKCNEETARLCS